MSIFIFLKTPDDYRSDMDDDHDLEADIDSDSKTAKTNADKEQLFAESVERHSAFRVTILIQTTSMRSTIL